MLDFLKISTRIKKDGVTEIYPSFIMNNKSQDLMIRGSDFYAIWVEKLNSWSTDEQDAISMIDAELDIFKADYTEKYTRNVTVLYMRDADSLMIDKWHKYCQKQMRDNFHPLDETLIFSNTKTTKKDYSSKCLPYPLEKGNTPAYDKLMSTLYSEEERHKIEWAIGAIVSGDSKEIQKFMVLYGSAGTGKSTVLNIIQQLFEGYYSVFDAKALGSSSNSFALEAFKTNPLVAIQHDGDLSKIEDNTRLNSLVSHELMTVNEKFKSTYPNRFKCFLFMGTNKPVKITDGKSGLIRRLIDVHPSGNKLSASEYKTTTKQVKFELGAIASHCLEVYLDDPGIYDNYIPATMLGASNDFYNFVIDSYHVFKREDGTTLKAAWEMYKLYCEEAKVPYPFSQRSFKEELKNYFWDFNDLFDMDDGNKVRSYYSGFRTDIFKRDKIEEKKEEIKPSGWIEFSEQDSIFDRNYSECPAQYTTTEGTPVKKWDNVKTKLSDIDTSRLHYVKIPENHIVIDFDIPGDDGKKSFEKNLEAANKWPATYAELSKSGAGIHLHYIYTGDINKLSRLYVEHIEIKVFTGKSSLRRKLTKCNNLSIATISSGLPLKGDDKVINFEGFKNENALRTIINRNLEKEIHSSTRCSIDFIYKNLEDAYNSGMRYDVSDMKNDVVAFAAQSTNQSDYCLKLVNKMKFKSEEAEPGVNNDDQPIVFYDIEVFPNLFLVCWKLAGEGNPVVKMINPKPSDIEDLLKYRLIGFNNRSYDNHMIYACMMGYTNEQLYDLSKRLINDDKDISRKAKFSSAFNLSYTDIYDFASAGNKKSLKKLEIEMSKLSESALKKKGYNDTEIRLIKAGTHHQELGLDWNKPVPEGRWFEVAEYCTNDVVATEAAFHYLKGDWIARQILADITGMTENDTTNSLSQRIIFGLDKNPQSQFNYRDLSKPVGSDQYEEYKIKFGEDYKFRVFGPDGLPLYRDYIPGEVLPEGYSILPFFPGYTFRLGVSTYLGEEIGEGGRVYSEPGIYGNVWDGDVTGQHPSSIIAEVLFGPKYTKAFKEIVDGRVSIKHQAWQDIDELFDGKLKPYIQQVIDGELTAKDLAAALKTVVNAVYGQTKASYKCAFRDDRNVDNIVAKRGALFMTLLKQEVQKQGFKVAHIKTDSIKIPDATPEIQDFVINFGKEYGYSFETEAEFEKFCLVNKAVYIAKTKDGEWTATGDQFAVPYVFKTLFSHENITFDDMCETFAVKKGALYLDMNEGLIDVTREEKELSKLEGQFKKGTISDVTFEQSCAPLVDAIQKGHDYHFVGRVGQFCPIKPGFGGGELYRYDNNKYYAAAGSTGYRWLESEMIRGMNEDAIDRSYYDNLVNDAVETIYQYGDFDWFVSDDPYVSTNISSDFMNEPVSGIAPPWAMPCGDEKYETCMNCPNFNNDLMDCAKGYNISEIIKKMENSYDPEEIPFK